MGQFTWKVVMAAQLRIDAMQVFIVDDDSSVRDALSLLLRIEGFSPFVFGDAGSFLDAFRRRQPVCIILDINLPGESGLEVLRELAVERPPPPVVVMSGQGDIATVVSAMKFGAFLS